MKKVILTLFIICFLASSTLFAQFDIGVIGGINVASFNVENEEDDVSSRTLWNIGAVVEYKLNNNFSLKTEPMFLKKGGILEAANTNPKLTFDQSFLELPMLLKYSMGNENKVFFIAGPTIGLNLSSDLEADIDGIIFTADLKDLTETLDFGICVGVGFSINVLSGNLFAQGKYTFGLTNLAKNGTFTAKAGHLELDASLDEEESKYQTRGLQISIGYTYSL